MRNRKYWEKGSKLLAFAMAVMMILAVIPVSPVPVLADGAKYINFYQIENADSNDGTDVAVKYEGTKITATGTDWGNDWGGDSKWQIQLKELVPVTANEKYTVSFTITSDVARSIFLKLGDVDNNDAVFLEDTIALEAGVPKTYTQTTTSPVNIDKLMVLFALGDQANTNNTITIENLELSGENSGKVILPPQTEEIDTSKGKEYDFSATADNAANDYADPGKSKDGYTLIWADEFDGNYGGDQVDADTGLDLSNWAYQLGDGSTDCNNSGWGNKELECYTGNKKNISVNEDLNGDGIPDGLLRITASYEADGYKYAEESAKDYTSARIRTTTATEALFNSTYGYIEARMSLPGTKGAWPAFWMLPQSTDIYGGWPVSGEIDIMETCGAFSDGVNNQACGTLHWGAPDHVYKGSGYVDLASDYTYFHTYAVDWQPGQITWYYDGKAINTLSNWESGFSGASDTLSFDAPFDQPFYILLNLAVDSGQFGGNINKATFEEDINMYVDYVRVYQKTDGYADSAERSASSDTSSDWSNYAGKNQIADITSDNIVNDLPDGDMNSVEKNGTVDAGKWYLSYQAGSEDATAGAYTDANGDTWAKVGIKSKGSQDYSVQLIGHYDAKADYVYKVSFDAYADGDMVGKTVNCDSKEWSGWSTYGISSFELKDSATTYSYLIGQTEDFENCRIEFNLGAKASGNVYIGNVKVEIVDPALISQEKEQRSALADGNLIYNGTFDQGSNHLGYWSVTDGTSAVVPRYTTTKLADTDVSVVDIASKSNYENIADGVKYYERRAQVSAAAGVAPAIYQKDLKMIADNYTLNFDMYSAADTTVTAAIYTVKDGVLGEELLEASANYKAVDGVKNFSWVFDTKEDIENAALVLRFGTGASVQVDNVSLIGKSQAQEVDETPITADLAWNATDGVGNALTLTNSGGVYTLKNVTSGGTDWYDPQIVSDNFSLVNGKQYKLSFQYKLEGTSNNTLEYMIQENSGSWYIYNDGPTKVYYDPANADENGFCTYETVFTADKTLNTVHMILGLGNSGGTGDLAFSFKNVTMSLVSAMGEDEEGSNSMLRTSYPIFYVLNGGTNAQGNPSSYIEGEGSAVLLAPVKDGYTFLGWTIGAEGTNYITAIGKDQKGEVTLYANWEENGKKTSEQGNQKDVNTVNNKNSKVDTGDNTPLVSSLMVLLLGAVMVAGVFGKKRRMNF